MFGNNDNSTDLMLPILLDMANLIRRAVRSGKEPREVKIPYEPAPPQLLRRSFTEDTVYDDEPFETGVELTTMRSRRILPRNHTNRVYTGDRVKNAIHRETNFTNRTHEVSKLNDDTTQWYKFVFRSSIILTSMTVLVAL